MPLDPDASFDPDASLTPMPLFISTTADADPIVVLGFDLLLVGQVRKIQADLFMDRLALLIQTGTAALPQPIDIEGHPRFPGTREWAAPSAPRVDGPVRSPPAKPLTGPLTFKFN